jgi:hypothetical protein
MEELICAYPHLKVMYKIRSGRLFYRVNYFRG